MDWKIQLTKTPYLVLFIVLITVGVGTASALITITLAGDVIITDSLNVDTDTLVVNSANDRVGIGVASPTQKLDVDGNVQIGNSLFVGTTTSGDVHSIWMADGSERFLWDGVTDNRFETTDDLAIGGNAFVFGDLEIDGNVNCPNCILGFYTVTRIKNGNGGVFFINVPCDEGDVVTGGGYDSFTTNSLPSISTPFGGPPSDGWSALWEVSENGASYAVLAICADFAPIHVP